MSAPPNPPAAAPIRAPAAASRRPKALPTIAPVRAPRPVPTTAPPTALLLSGVWQPDPKAQVETKSPQTANRFLNHMAQFLLMPVVRPTAARPESLNSQSSQGRG